MGRGCRWLFVLQLFIPSTSENLLSVFIEIPYFVISGPLLLIIFIFVDWVSFYILPSVDLHWCSFRKLMRISWYFSLVKTWGLLNFHTQLITWKLMLVLHCVDICDNEWLICKLYFIFTIFLYISVHRTNWCTFLPGWTWKVRIQCQRLSIMWWVSV